MNRLLLSLLPIVCGLRCAVAQVTLADFGHGVMNPPSHRTLLVIYAVRVPGNAFHMTKEEFADYVFKFGPGQTVNGYFLENSHGRFSLSRVGLLGVFGGVVFTQADQDAFNAPAPAGDDQKPERIYRGVVLAEAVNQGLDLSIYDQNHDGTLTYDELIVCIVSNDSNKDGGGVRHADPTGASSGAFTPAGSSVSLNLNVLEVPTGVGFATLCHEVGHKLQGERATEVYYYWKRDDANEVLKPTPPGPTWTATLNAGLTVMSATIGRPHNTDSVHFDPWHKLQLGWSEPRLVSMSAGGRFTIDAAQSSDTTTPIILYDSQHGLHEFLILEYRARKTTSNAVDYDKDLKDADNQSSGLCIWHITTSPTHTLASVPSPPWAPPPGMFPASPPSGIWLDGSVLSNAPSGTTPRVPDRMRASGQTISNLVWNDGTPIPVQLRIAPAVVDVTSVSIEILASSDTWVDFSFPGLPLLPEGGTFDFPYNTFLEGRTAVGYGGHLRIKPGQTAETVMNLNKPMTIHAEGGPVTIGRQP